MDFSSSLAWRSACCSYRKIVTGSTRPVCHLQVGTSDAKVQIWDAARGKQIRELCGHTNRVSAVSWAGTTLSSGGRDSVICCWDVRKRRDEACVAKLEAHEQEVIASYTLYGSCAHGRRCEPYTMILQTSRTQPAAAQGCVLWMCKHCLAATSSCSWIGRDPNGMGSGQLVVELCIVLALVVLYCVQICGLKWSSCGQQLASGGNDNALCIWDANFRLVHKVNAHQVRRDHNLILSCTCSRLIVRVSIKPAAAAAALQPSDCGFAWLLVENGPRLFVCLQAAVKALAWCPFQSNLLATGGGTADRCIKFWNTHTGANLSSIDTGSQVRTLCSHQP